MSIDLSASYLRAVTNALPNAVVVADRFHLVRIADELLTEVRPGRHPRTSAADAAARDPEWPADGSSVTKAGSP